MCNATHFERQQKLWVFAFCSAGFYRFNNSLHQLCPSSLFIPNCEEKEISTLVRKACGKYLWFYSLLNGSCTVIMFSSFSPQRLHSVVSVGPLQHQTPAVQMGAVAQGGKCFLGGGEKTQSHDHSEQLQVTSWKCGCTSILNQTENAILASETIICSKRNPNIGKNNHYYTILCHNAAALGEIWHLLQAIVKVFYLWNAQPSSGSFSTQTFLQQECWLCNKKMWNVKSINITYTIMIYI